jgi:ATP-dependent Lon protease
VEGEKGKQGIISKLKKTLEEKKAPPHVIKIFEEEIRKFSSIDEMSSESNIIRTYLDWLVSLPYGVKIL